MTLLSSLKKLKQRYDEKYYMVDKTLDLLIESICRSLPLDKQEYPTDDSDHTTSISRGELTINPNHAFQTTDRLDLNKNTKPNAFNPENTVTTSIADHLLSIEKTYQYPSSQVHKSVSKPLNDEHYEPKTYFQGDFCPLLPEGSRVNHIVLKSGAVVEKKYITPNGLIHAFKLMDAE